MAVYERAYRPYAGAFAPDWSRFLVIPRYAYRGMFASKLFSAFFALCFAAPAAFMVAIYLRNNLSALELLGVPEASVPQINVWFFLILQTVQGFLAFFLVVAVGPALVAPDMTNNALALYLSRPLSRAEYIAGKMAVLVILMSLMTWIPGLILFGLQSYLAGWEWLSANSHLAGAILLSSGISILLLSLMSLAISAWVKRKMLARVMTLAVFFVLGGFGTAINAITGTRWGDLIDLDDLLATVWARLYGMPATADSIPQGVAWAGLITACALFLFLLARKVKAYEVVR